MIARSTQQRHGRHTIRASSRSRRVPGCSHPTRDPPTAMSTTATISTPVGTTPLTFDAYRDLSDAELGERILAVKRRMGDELLILGHHYQQDEVIRYADLRGDSYKLSQ